LKEAYQQLINVALQKMPTLAVKQNAPATQNAITDLEKLIGKKLPQQFVDLYLITDGNAPSCTRFFNGLRLLSIAEITQQWLAMQAIKTSDAFVIDGKELHADADEKIKNGWWNVSWLPITDNLSGDYTAIDLDPNTKGTYGQIIEYWHDPSFRNCLAPSLQDWILQTANEIENGILKYDENYEGFVKF
jgi:cell wall assembly regulator SMI1